MGEGFAGGVDTDQSYDLWVRMDRALPLVKPLTAYANGVYFNVNSIEVIMQHAYRWEKLRMTIDKYAEIVTTSTTTTTTPTTTTTTPPSLTSLYFITPTIEGGITTPHQALQHTIQAGQQITFKTATGIIPTTDWGDIEAWLYIELLNDVTGGYFNIKIYRYNSVSQFLVADINIDNTSAASPLGIYMGAIDFDLWTQRSANDGLWFFFKNNGAQDQVLKCDATDETSLLIEI
jgi:hypothetical protein